MDGWILITLALFGEVDRWHNRPTPFSDLPFPFAIHLTEDACKDHLKKAYGPSPIPKGSECVWLEDAKAEHPVLFEKPYQLEAIGKSDERIDP